MPLNSPVHNNTDEERKEKALEDISNDLLSIFEESKELDHGSTVSPQIVLNPPTSKASTNTEDTEAFLDGYKKNLLKSTEVTGNYHKNEISSVKALIENSIKLMWVIAILSIASTIICAVLHLNSGLVTFPIFGTLLEAITGYITKILNDTLRTKEKFFEKEIEIEKYDKVLGIILTVSQDYRKTDLIEKVVNAYFELEKSNFNPQKNEDNK